MMGSVLGLHLLKCNKFKVSALTINTQKNLCSLIDCTMKSIAESRRSTSSFEDVLINRTKTTSQMVLLKGTDQIEQTWHEPVEALDQWCIYRIPSKLRNVNEAAYTPQLISIGPFHYGNRKLRDMESHKRQYFANFCKFRSSKSKDQLESFIRNREEMILRCYAGAMDRDVDFVEVILVDACFIFELFLTNSGAENNANYYILRSPLVRKAVEQDLILFENQLPYYLLQELFDFAMSDDSSGTNEQQTLSIDHSLLKLTIEFFKEYTKGEPVRNGEKVKHFTDLVRHFLLPTETMKWVGNGENIYTPTENVYHVRKLKEAGVKFWPNNDTERFVIKCEEDHKRCLNLACFRKMDVKLTKFWARYEIECVIRNVMALEQLVYTEDAYVCSYFLMLDQLVDTVEDVNLLIEDGVIINLLGNSEQVFKMINSLCEQIMDGRSCYVDISEQLNKHYKVSLWNRNVSILKRVYFKDLWTGSSTVVGMFVLIFSIMGTIKSLK